MTAPPAAMLARSSPASATGSPPSVLAAAKERSAAVGVGADRALIAAGAIDEEDYLRALGEQLGVAFEPLDGLPRRLCPLDDERLIEAARTGLLPVSEE